MAHDPAGLAAEDSAQDDVDAECRRHPCDPESLPARADVQFVAAVRARTRR
jgi:hypothetical protein